jgi:hypothetical protein
MEPEHERPADKEFGPKFGLVRRRILGGGVVPSVAAFLAVVLALNGSDNPRAMFSAARDGAPHTLPSIWWFLLGGAGLAAAALAVPWLFPRRAKAGLDLDREPS